MFTDDSYGEKEVIVVIKSVHANESATQIELAMSAAIFLFGLALNPPLRAVSFASNLLSPQPVAVSVLQRLRAIGVPYIAAVGEAGDITAALVECGALDGVFDYGRTNEPIGAIELMRAAGNGQWVHVCDTVPRLAAARRVGARTIWLNELAAADENSEGLASAPGDDSSYLARAIIADLASGVCAALTDLPATLEQVRFLHS